MLRCLYCGARVPDDALTCVQCGAPPPDTPEQVAITWGAWHRSTEDLSAAFFREPMQFPDLDPRMTVIRAYDRRYLGPGENWKDYEFPRLGTLLYLVMRSTEPGMVCRFRLDMNAAYRLVDLPPVALPIMLNLGIDLQNAATFLRCEIETAPADSIRYLDFLYKCAFWRVP